MKEVVLVWSVIGLYASKEGNICSYRCGVLKLEPTVILATLNAGYLHVFVGVFDLVEVLTNNLIHFVNQISL